MSQGIHLLSCKIPGYQPLEGKCLLCSGVPGMAVSYNSSHGDLSTLPYMKVFMMRNPLSLSKVKTLICSASSSGHRKNPDFSRQNKQNHGFSRNKNRQNPDKGNSEGLEESEILSSKNGPLLSLSNTPRYQATATPGPREKEIVELFRKVQAQLRERAKMKEEKKIETFKEPGKESGTVDSLLKLLRKHSVEQGRRKSSGSRDSIFGQLDQNNPFAEEEQSPNFFESNSSTREDSQESNEPNAAQFKRPVSNFRRRSPIPRVKYQPVYSTKQSISSTLHLKSRGRGKRISSEPEPTTMPVSMPEPEPEPELVLEPEPEPEPEPEAEPELELESYSDSLEVHNEGDLGSMTDSEISDISGTYNGVAAETSTSTWTEQTDLFSLKLSELRVLAKSRGLKGYSKMKKGELIEVLNSDMS